MNFTNMNQEKLTPKEYFRSLQIVHLALMAGIVSFIVIAIVLQNMGFESDGEDMLPALIYVVPVFMIGGILASNYVFKFRLKTCISQSGLKQKLEEYRSALIIKFALVEGPSFFAIIAYLLTANLVFVGITVLLLAVLLSYRPTPAKSIIDLELDYDEREILEETDAEIR
ncbi:hypothetical protein [Maribellus sediminis]|uniref:hypothetical protein n=1 Tax=Maribellus sediminis TaxID=2696285 RepID=UPI0014312328|nr:hypothetical protein [Maribellus sediminis]